MGLLNLISRLDARRRRLDDLAPVGRTVREILTSGNRQMLLSGRNTDGSTAAPLALGTLRNRKGFGPPRVPMNANSRAVTGLVVTVTPSAARVRFTKSWPGFPQIVYLSDGTRRMPARPCVGFRAGDLAAARAALGDHARGD